MTKAEKNILYEEVAFLSDAQLKAKCLDVMFSTLGSQSELMIEQDCWSECDIIECRKYERFLSEKSDLLFLICHERGITFDDVFNDCKERI